MFIIAVFAAVLHLGWAIVLWNSDAIHTVAIAPLYLLSESSRVIAIGLVIMSLLPIAAKVWSRNAWLLLASLIPQQASLMMTCVSAMYCVLVSRYSDGVVRPRAFIAADQWGNIIPVILHTIYVARVYVECMAIRDDKREDLRSNEQRKP